MRIRSYHLMLVSVIPLIGSPSRVVDYPVWAAINGSVFLSLMIAAFVLAGLEGRAHADKRAQKRAAQAWCGTHKFEEIVRVAHTLGMRGDFTREAIKAAFKEAVRRVHIDAGGRGGDADALVKARDFLLAELTIHEKRSAKLARDEAKRALAKWREDAGLLGRAAARLRPSATYASLAASARS